jgi:hypothetical protein
MMGDRWGRTEIFTEYYHPKYCRQKNDTQNIHADLRRNIDSDWGKY